MVITLTFCVQLPISTYIRNVFMIRRARRSLMVSAVQGSRMQTNRAMALLCCLAYTSFVVHLAPVIWRFVVHSYFAQLGLNIEINAR
jgi:hypothetical protein